MKNILHLGTAIVNLDNIVVIAEEVDQNKNDDAEIEILIVSTSGVMRTISLPKTRHLKDFNVTR